MTFAVAKEAGASAEELQKTAANVNATHIRNAFNSMSAASGIAQAQQGGAGPAAAPGKT